MFYLFIYVFFLPFLLLFKYFRLDNNPNLIIQTAKIGDYVNTSIMIDALKHTDMIIDKANYDFASTDNRINNIFIINNYKKNLLLKIKLALIIYKNNYQNIYVVIPNSYNLFIVKMSFAKNKTTLKTYSAKWYFSILAYGIHKQTHTKEDLTLSSYIKMINPSYDYKNYQRIIQQPLLHNNSSEIDITLFNVGISLTAGNSLKTIDLTTWSKVIKILNEFNLDIYIFGISSEQKYFDNFVNAIQSNNSIISLLGKIKLRNLPSEISKMQLYISSDTGNSYIADLQNIPVINFAGPCYMKEQRPIGEHSMIVKSNTKNVPFSFIFKAPYTGLYDNLYIITKKQEEEIQQFITKIYTRFQSS